MKHCLLMAIHRVAGLIVTFWWNALVCQKGTACSALLLRQIEPILRIKCLMTISASIKLLYSSWLFTQVSAATAVSFHRCSIRLVLLFSLQGCSLTVKQLSQHDHSIQRRKSQDPVLWQHSSEQDASHLPFTVFLPCTSLTVLTRPQPFDHLLWGLTQSTELATLSQWPHQRTTQRNRNDRLFIIAQLLCRRGKSIIKTRLTAKITAVSSIVLEQANFFSSRVSWPVQHHLGAICSPSQIPLPFGIGFTWLIHTVNALSFQWEKRKRFCVKLPEESEGFGFVGTALCLPLTFQQEECPHYGEGLGASWGRQWNKQWHE